MEPNNTAAIDSQPVSGSKFDGPVALLRSAWTLVKNDWKLLGLIATTPIIDGEKGFSAFTESYCLVKGRWWGVFGRLVFAGVLYLIAFMVLAITDFIVSLIFGSKSATTSILAIVIQIAFTVTVVPLLMAYTFKLYQSLKATRVSSVATGAFKKWLIAFSVIGIIAIVSIPII